MFLYRAQIVAAAIGLAVVTYMVILVLLDFVGTLHEIAAGHTYIRVSLVGPILAALPFPLIAASFPLRRFVVLKAGPVDGGQAQTVFMNSMLVALAFIEIGAIGGLVFGLLTANLFWPAMTFALTLAGFALHFPTKSRFEAFLNGTNA